MQNEMWSGMYDKMLDVMSGNNLYHSNDEKTIDQNIHIDANFPSVTGAEDVEAALLSLAGESLQYSYKNFG
jgi:hypothetical protein